MVLPPKLTGWVSLLLLAASVPALWRGVYGALSVLGLGTLVERRPRPLLGDGVFAVVVGLMTGGGLLLFYRPTLMLALVLVSPGLAVLGGIVCVVFGIRARGEGAADGGGGGDDGGAGDAGEGGGEGDGGAGEAEAGAPGDEAASP